jgi:dTMP kinase
MSTPGKLIVFEGIDGTGKTTLAARLAARLREGGAEGGGEAGVEVVETREPWTSRHGDELRKVLAARERKTTRAQELDLFEKDRAEHVQQLVAPALARGAWVVQDRTFWSTAAYQASAAVPAATIVARNRKFAPLPDLTLLLLLAPERALERIARSRAATSSFERLESLRAVDRVYRELAAGEKSIVALDADRPLAVVAADVERICRERLGRP